MYKMNERFLSDHVARLFFLLSFLLCTSFVHGQNKITGTVVDDTGEPVIGASVVISGTSSGSVTDLNGNFTLNNVPDKSQLTVSYVGFLTQKANIRNG